MLYIKKQPNPPIDFLNAKNGLEKYEELKGDARKTVVEVLLKEQGDMCAFCERKKDKFTPTIEHFLPQSIFPHLQLDYHNLYIACSRCNEPKDKYLIPAYIFDPRFAPTDTTKEHPKPIYYLQDGKCRTVVPEAAITPKSMLPLHYHSYLLQNTLDLLRLNRNNANESSLPDMRGDVWKNITTYIQGLSTHELQEKYKRLLHNIQQGNYPEFASLHVYLYELVLKKKGMQEYITSTKQQYSSNTIM